MGVRIRTININENLYDNNKFVPVRAEEWGLVEACLTPVPSYIGSSEQEKVKSYHQKISKWQSQVSERLQALNR
ncbi:hypothetical protein Ddye_027222 [Dipteronia dyeriana]|uniref:Uncharacterized protein n=1 Tax=Dipteronia dyeriana TaxID=168575 RepID=A0AAD9TNN6_9ROSI|nr:hypothetical protein Ddye_027222 [Dipteronia dyeriana]